MCPLIKKFKLKKGIDSVKKRMLSIMLCIILVFAMAVPAFATDGDSTIPSKNSSNSETSNGSYSINTQDQLKDIDQQLSNIEASSQFSEDQKQAAAEKAEYLKNLLSGNPVPVTYSDSQTNRVPYYRQEEDYYCGPASIQQTLGHYYYSPMPTQEDIYGDTDQGATAAMRDYLNACLNPDEIPGSIWYSVWWNHYTKNMKTTITAIAGAGTPIIVHVLPIYSAGRTSYTDTAHWPYTNTISGHYMSISGYMNSGDQIQLTDPFIMWTSAGKSDSRYSTGKYYVDFAILDAVGDRLIT